MTTVVTTSSATLTKDEFMEAFRSYLRDKNIPLPNNFNVELLLGTNDLRDANGSANAAKVNWTVT